VLRIPTIGTPFVLHTDASGKAVGATLGELDDQGVEQPLAFASQKLTETQMAWATIEREAGIRHQMAYASRLTVSGILYSGHVCPFSVIITCSSAFVSAPVKVLSCCDGRLHFRNLILRFSIRRGLTMLLLIGCLARGSVLLSVYICIFVILCQDSSQYLHH